MSKELLNCPFCGGEANCNNMGLVDHRDKPLWWVVCLECKVSTHGDGTKEQAIAAWNRRPEQWIPVSDRLPERNDHILTYMPSKNCYAEATEVSRGFMLGLKNSIVTHWMPLPQPPEGGAE